MMNSRFFTIPLDTNKIISNKEHATCDMKESIAHFIHLITTAYFGECTFDDTFGCSIWDVDFDNLTSTNKIKTFITDSLFDSIKRHEKRLTQIDVHVVIKQAEIKTSTASNIIKKKVSIKVLGKVKKTDEDFLYNEFFYIGPLSY
ncbi:GPW/gp25 family protein [uncultured Algibacter sp.]|uniref:GPW/gp25 family protein n=1 Tax=uncultured Algibacter sp. TaxID=298659 RepID=UPI0032179B4D